MSESPAAPTLEAALIVPVPEAEDLVGDFRRRFDPSAAVGVPAHITINYPFKPHFNRPAESHTTLLALFSRFSQFPFTLSEVRTFPGVIYLAPTPSAPFINLIDAVASAFPDAPPYEGQFDHPVPHLTVAQVEEAALASIHADFSRQAIEVLPLLADAREVRLIDNAGTLWKTTAVFPLKPG